MSRRRYLFSHMAFASLAVALILGFNASLHAENPAVNAAERGKALAERVCSNCHLVSDQQAKAVADVPSFREIANTPNLTEGEIMAGIVIPKHPMPVIPLTKHELEDLAAYIMSLRSE